MPETAMGVWMPEGSNLGASLADGFWGGMVCLFLTPIKGAYG